ncbi:MAG: glycosyltransferase family 1 protein [Vicinamibacterales bacterium]
MNEMRVASIAFAVLQILRARAVHHDGCAGARERLVELDHDRGGAVVRRANHHAVRLQEVLDGRALLEELGIADDAERVRRLAPDDVAHQLRRAGRHRALVHDDRVARHRAGRLLRRREHVLQVRRTVLPGGRADRDEDHLRLAHRLGQLRREAQPPLGPIAPHQVLETGLVNRDAPALQLAHLGRVLVHTHHVVSGFREAGPDDQSHIARANHGNLHESVLSATSKLLKVACGPEPVNRLKSKELSLPKTRPSLRDPPGARDSIARVSPVRILLDYRPALRERTGVGEYVHELARALAASAPPGEDLRLFSASWKDRAAPDAVPGATIVDRRIPVALLNFAWHRWQWPPAETLAGTPLDVAHSAHPLLMPTRGAARIVTVHDLDFLDHPERTVREIRRDYPALAARHARAADQVVAVSAHTAREVAGRLGVAPERISVCSPGGPSWPRRDREPDGGYLLFLGTLEPRKNVGALVEAYGRLLARMPDAPRLVLAGRATPAAAALVERVGAPPFAGRVNLPGYITPADREALYRGALAFVLPSHTEGFGIPALEAMTCGVPVIAANRGALPEVLGGAGRLIDPDDPADLARALADVAGDRHLRDRMRDAGWRRAGLYRWADTAARVRDAWALALEQRASRANAHARTGAA